MRAVKPRRRSIMEPNGSDARVVQGAAVSSPPVR